MFFETQLSNVFYTTGRIAGILGFLSLSFLIFSGDMARFFDRYFGLDKIIKFQRKFALSIALFIIFHPLFFIISDRGFLKYLIPDFSLFPLALGTLSFYIFIVFYISSLLYKRISYKFWQYLHILSYILFFFSLYHAKNWGSSAIYPFMKIIYFVSLVIVIIGIIYRTQYKIREIFEEKFYLDHMEEETENVFTVFLKRDNQKKFNFDAGQFCFLRINKDNLYARHPFTISSSPLERNISFTIKDTGRFTKTIRSLREGEKILVDGPFGTFKLNENNRDIVFIAGGIGITPFFSIIKDLLDRKNNKNVLLIYASKTKKEIVFKKEFDSIKKDWFKIVYVLSRENLLSEGYENGHIDKKLIKKYIKGMNDPMFYICGPENMEKSLKNDLKEIGIKKRDIIIESFFW